MSPRVVPCQTDEQEHVRVALDAVDAALDKLVTDLPGSANDPLVPVLGWARAAILDHAIDRRGRCRACHRWSLRKRRKCTLLPWLLALTRADPGTRWWLTYTQAERVSSLPTAELPALKGWLSSNGQQDMMPSPGARSSAALRDAL